MTRTAATGRTHRTDAEIFADVRIALDRCGNVPGGVRVHVDRGTVTLTGGVRVLSERAEAEDVVRHIEGVQRLVNDITVAKVPSAEAFEAPDDV